jgi:hypothetical protein
MIAACDQALTGLIDGAARDITAAAVDRHGDHDGEAI